MEATVGAFFLVDVAAAEEEPPGFSLENRAEMNWGKVRWKGRTTLISSNGYLLQCNGVWV